MKQKILLTILLSTVLTACWDINRTTQDLRPQNKESEPLKNTTPHVETVDFFSGKNGDQAGIQCPVEIKPGEFIGPIELYMPRQNIFATGLKVKQLKGSPDNYLVGPFQVVITNGSVTQVAVEPAYLKQGCLKYDNKTIGQNATMAELRSTFEDCKPIDMRKGGGRSECTSITISQGSIRDAKPTLTIH